MPQSKKISDKKVNFKKATNLILVAFALLVLLHPPMKAWVLKQLMNVGFFKADIKKDYKGSSKTTAFSVMDNEGNKLDIDDFKGKVVFINFWATWCPPCIAEMPSLNKLYNHFSTNDSFVFLFISEDINLETAQKFLNEKSYNMKAVKKISNIDKALYDGTLPTTVVLNKEGNIIFKHTGLANYDNDDFIKQLNELQ